jgi:hypothetical protein
MITNIAQIFNRSTAAAVTPTTQPSSVQPLTQEQLGLVGGAGGGNTLSPVRR